MRLALLLFRSFKTDFYVQYHFFNFLDILPSPMLQFPRGRGFSLLPSPRFILVSRFSFPLPTSLSGSGVAPLSLQRSYGLATHRVFSFSIINLPPTSWLLTTKERSGLYLLYYRFIPAERSDATPTQCNALQRTVMHPTLCNAESVMHDGSAKR